MSTLQQLCILETESINDALKKLDQSGARTLMVIKENGLFLGTLSDGDIRRHLIAGKTLSETISSSYHKNAYFYYENEWYQKEAKALFLKEKIELIPILSKQHHVCSYLTWDSLFSEKNKIPKNPINIPVFIMAGGKGTRMEPFTKILPKPLIPIGEKPIIQVIIEHFESYGVNQFFLSLNHKAEMIQSYLNQLSSNSTFQYFFEKDFMGTAWSLSLAKQHLKDTTLLTNCDILIKADYADIVSFHQKNNAALTLVTAVHHHAIPYGVVLFKEGGIVKEIQEKPEQTVVINTGIYVLEERILKYIPDHDYLDMTTLITNLIQAGEIVTNYPVTEKQFMDIGQWEEYKKTTKFFDSIMDS